MSGRIADSHANAKAKTASTNFHSAIETLAAYIDLAFEERVNTSISPEIRCREIKSIMMSHGWSNGKAAAYSKMASRLADILIYPQNGRTEATGKTDYWKERRRESNPRIRTKKIHSYLLTHCVEQRIHTVKDLAISLGVKYGK